MSPKNRYVEALPAASEIPDAQSPCGTNLQIEILGRREDHQRAPAYPSRVTPLPTLTTAKELVPASRVKRKKDKGADSGNSIGMSYKTSYVETLLRRR